MKLARSTVLYIIIILHQTATMPKIEIDVAGLYIIIILHQTATGWYSSSIHAPVGGATVHGLGRECGAVSVSIHAPVGGATWT